MPGKTITMSRVLRRNKWDENFTKYDVVEIEDAYDPMTFDDFVNNIGYLLEGHKGQTITINVRMDKEGE